MTKSVFIGHREEFLHFTFNDIFAVFLTTVFTESYREKIVLSPMEKVRKVAMLSFVHAPEIEIFPSAQLHILSRNYSLKNTPLVLHEEWSLLKFYLQNLNRHVEFLWPRVSAIYVACQKGDNDQKIMCEWIPNDDHAICLVIKRTKQIQFQFCRTWHGISDVPCFRAFYCFGE